MRDRPRIGVLAVQGDLREHAAVLRGLGADVREVRKPEQLDSLELVAPGGESTAFIARQQPADQGGEDVGA